MGPAEPIRSTRPTGEAVSDPSGCAPGDLAPGDLDPGGPTPGEHDRELVVRARRDPGAFGVLYRRYAERIYAFAHRRTWSPEAAEDVTAATFERAYRHLDRFDVDGSGFGPWLYRIAANELVDHYRREGRSKTRRGQRALRALADEPTHDDHSAIEREDDVERMLAAMSTLRPRYQQVLTLRYLSGMSTDDAAAAMDCSKAVLAVTLHRALGALRRVYDRPEAPG